MTASLRRVSHVVLPVVESGPEALFRLGEIDVEGDVFRGSMACGDWLAGPSGRLLSTPSFSMMPSPSRSRPRN